MNNLQFIIWLVKARGLAIPLVKYMVSFTAGTFILVSGVFYGIAHFIAIINL